MVWFNPSSFNLNNICFLVNRLIKYTSFGNAADMLYDLGILNLQDSSNKDQYSSDSDEFDIENLWWR